MKRLIISMISAMALFGFVGCVTHNHTQAMRNQTGVTVVSVYTRDAGSTSWGSPRNTRARTNRDGQIIRRPDGSVAFWDRFNVNSGTEIVLFRDGSNAETPRGIRNQDIRIVDSNGFMYTKYNVPIEFTTTTVPFFGRGETLNRSEPIVFTVQDRHPIVTINNATGFQAVVSSPFPQQQRVNTGASTIWMSPELHPNRDIRITYMVGMMQYTADVFVGSDDVIHALTGRPPIVTLINNTGVTINHFWMRTHGALTWEGGNIRIRDGTLVPSVTAAVGDISGSIINGDRAPIWMGNFSLGGDRFDIRITDVNNVDYVISNVVISTDDITLTFTQANRN